MNNGKNVCMRNGINECKYNYTHFANTVLRFTCTVHCFVIQNHKSKISCTVNCTAHYRNKKITCTEPNYVQ